ncbi:MAG: MraY family glycosyltransferase [Stenotrophomonas sp.]
MLSSFPWLLVICAVGAVVTWAAIRYARRRQLFDLPGERRSHRVSTPRGGGVGIVVSQLLACVLGGVWLPQAALTLTAFALGLLLVAGIGWWDDHKPLPALPRLFIHLLAGLLLGWLVWQGTGSLWKALLCALLGVSLINIWNFMDGINGLASTQAIIVGIGVGLLLPAPYALAAWSLVAGCAGFLPFNCPRARIFMGDVGSGALGYLVAGLLALGISVTDVALPLWLMLPTAFFIDAGLTLLGRMARGESWMQAHTQHLYQVWVKNERSHVFVTFLYALFSIVGAILAALFSGRPPEGGWAGGVTWVAVGTAAWFLLRARAYQPG